MSLGGMIPSGWHPASKNRKTAEQKYILTARLILQTVNITIFNDLSNFVPQ
jgi:hypothetical protein